MDKCIVGEICSVPNSNINISVQNYEIIGEKLTNYKHYVMIGTDQNFDLLKAYTHSKTWPMLHNAKFWQTTVGSFEYPHSL